MHLCSKKHSIVNIMESLINGLDMNRRLDWANESEHTFNENKSRVSSKS